MGDVEMKPKTFAMLTADGTACSETVLTADEFTAANRARIEAALCDGTVDSPVAGSWVDVSENEAFAEPDADTATHAIARSPNREELLELCFLAQGSDDAASIELAEAVRDILEAA